MPSWTRWLGLSALVIVLDQLTKSWITSAFQLGDSLTITGFFNLVLAYNTGAAFSFLAGAGGWQETGAGGAQGSCGGPSSRKQGLAAVRHRCFRGVTQVTDSAKLVGE